MSKRSSKSARFAASTDQAAAGQGRRPPVKPGGGSVRPIKPPKGRSTAVRVSERKQQAHKVNLQAVKIIAAVLGVICLAGGIGVMAVTQSPYPAERIITVVLLGFFAGLSLFAALRTERFVDSFQKLVK